METMTRQAYEEPGPMVGAVCGCNGLPGMVVRSHHCADDKTTSQGEDADDVGFFSLPTGKCHIHWGRGHPGTLLRQLLMAPATFKLRMDQKSHLLIDIP